MHEETITKETIMGPDGPDNVTPEEEKLRRDLEIFRNYDELVANENYCFNSSYKDLVGVYFDIKSASLAGFSDNDGKMKQMIVKTAQDLGIIVRQLDDGNLILSKNEIIINDLATAFDKQHQIAKNESAFFSDAWKDNQREIGTLLGYPKTAIDAFVGDTERLSNKDANSIPFCDIAVSKDHYQEEVESFVKPLGDLFQRLMPHTARKYLEEEELEH